MVFTIPREWVERTTVVELHVSPSVTQNFSRRGDRPPKANLSSRSIRSHLKAHRREFRQRKERNQKAEESESLVAPGRRPLTRDVPQLQAHERPAVPVEDFQGEVHPDGGPVVLGEELVHIALDDAGFTHAEFADDQHLEEVLVGLGRRGGRRPRVPQALARHGHRGRGIFHQAVRTDLPSRSRRPLSRESPDPEPTARSRPGESWCTLCRVSLVWALPLPAEPLVVHGAPCWPQTARGSGRPVFALSPCL